MVRRVGHDVGVSCNLRELSPLRFLSMEGTSQNTMFFPQTPTGEESTTGLLSASTEAAPKPPASTEASSGRAEGTGKRWTKIPRTDAAEVKSEKETVKAEDTETKNVFEMNGKPNEPGTDKNKENPGKEKEANPKPQDNPKQSPAANGPVIYCCFNRRFGGCRHGRKCRHMHARNDFILSQHIHYMNTFGLCERQVPGHPGYPCRHHGNQIM